MCVNSLTNILRLHFLAAKIIFPICKSILIFATFTLSFLPLLGVKPLWQQAGRLVKALAALLYGSSTTLLHLQPISLLSSIVFEGGKEKGISVSDP